eukprot:591306-Amphidinium_carterae.3
MNNDKANKKCEEILGILRKKNLETVHTTRKQGKQIVTIPQSTLKCNCQAAHEQYTRARADKLLTGLMRAPTTLWQDYKRCFIC